MSEPVCIPPASQVDLKREERLEEIRHAAEKQGQLKVVGARPPGAPFHKQQRRMVTIRFRS